MDENWLGQITWSPYYRCPQGWAWCDGSLLRVEEHRALFSLLGKRFGGDGVKTFGLPNLVNRTIVGTGEGGGESYGLGEAMDRLEVRYPQTAMTAWQESGKHENPPSATVNTVPTRPALVLYPRICLRGTVPFRPSDLATA